MKKLRKSPFKYANEENFIWNSKIFVDLGHLDTYLKRNHKSQLKPLQILRRTWKSCLYSQTCFCCDYEMLKTKYHFPNRQNSRHRIYEIPSVCFFTSIRVKKRCKHDSPLSKEKPWQRAINHRPRNIRMTLNLNLTIAKMRGRTACQIIRLIFHFSQDFNTHLLKYLHSNAVHIAIIKKKVGCLIFWPMLLAMLPKCLQHDRNVMFL